MFVLFIFAFLTGAASVETNHYQDCKAHNFKPESLCGFEKKLDGLK